MFLDEGVLKPSPGVSTGVIVMTFWYVFIGTDLSFSNFLNFYFHSELITTPHVLYVHMTYVYSFSLMFHSSHDHMAKRSHYRIMIFFDFGVLLIYGRTPTLIFPFSFLNRTTPIFAIDVLVIRTDLQENPSGTRHVEIRQISTVRRRTMLGPD